MRVKVPCSEQKINVPVGGSGLFVSEDGVGEPARLLFFQTLTRVLLLDYPWQKFPDLDNSDYLSSVSS